MKKYEINSMLTAIANLKMGVDTLKTRHNDDIDFYDRPVWRIKQALEAAYNLGAENGIVYDFEEENKA